MNAFMFGVCMGVCIRQGEGFSPKKELNSTTTNGAM